jgi:hypothetical protein
MSAVDNNDTMSRLFGLTLEAEVGIDCGKRQ